MGSYRTAYRWRSGTFALQVLTVFLASWVLSRQSSKHVEYVQWFQIDWTALGQLVSCSTSAYALFAGREVLGGYLCQYGAKSSRKASLMKSGIKHGVPLSVYGKHSSCTFDAFNESLVYILLVLYNWIITWGHFVVHTNPTPQGVPHLTTLETLLST